MSDYPPCMEHLGDNRYQCKVHGFVVTTDVLPIHCNCSARKLYEETYGSPASADGGCRGCGGRQKRSRRKRGRPASVPRTDGFGPGSQLLAIYEAAGMPHCGECLKLASRMDGWGVVGCRERASEIVDDMLPRAKQWVAEHKPWMHRLAAGIGVEAAALRFVIDRDVRRAIAATEALLGPVAEQTELAAIVPYFNFARSKSRARNHRLCIEGLIRQGIPTYTPEAALEGQPFDVPEGACVHRYAVRDPLFVKEGLFNLTLQTLPVEYRAVAWIDSDAVFDRPDLAAATLEALREWPIVQLFSEIAFLGRDMQELSLGKRFYGRGIVYRNAMAKRKSANPRLGWPGMAWAGRRDVLEAMGGLYDGYPMGSGDVFAIAGFYGDRGLAYFNAYARQTMSHWWKTWGARSHEIVDSQIGHVHGVVRHLYHGNLKDRNYQQRHRMAKQTGFDPARHQERDANGLYQFSSACPAAMRTWAEDYMLRLRHEDGRPNTERTGRPTV